MDWILISEELEIFEFEFDIGKLILVLIDQM